MRITRRSALASMGAALSAVRSGYADEKQLTLAPGPFHDTWESLATYRIPEWFHNAKFGIWAHWGPQSAIEAGDWYARNMYMQGSRQYEYHVKTYGHPSKFGYKDTIPNWHAAEWDPDHLIGLYKKAGARYFFSMGVHHDNFDLWNSKYQRWNAVQMGPKKDVVGIWRGAARKQGLKFGVSEHLWITYKWFTTSHGSDKTGSLAGVAYDGQDSKFWDLYTDDQHVYTELPWDENGITDAWKQHWHKRIRDLVDNYQPDLLYTDGALPFEKYGLNVVANLYNLKNGSAVYFSKKESQCAQGTCTLDVERGVADNIRPEPWQTDTCIGDWHYRRGVKYKRPKQVIDILVDVVSRNGNLLLNIPLPNSGKPDYQELQILDEITKWMTVNSEGIHDTRPFKVFGNAPAAPTGGDAKFNESKRQDLSASDVRFTTKGNTLYAFVMGDPGLQATVPLIASEPVRNIGLLGGPSNLQWKKDGENIVVTLPESKPTEHAICLRVQRA